MEELSREVKSIIETLEGIENANKKFSENISKSFVDGDTFNNTPFNEQEKEEIKRKLREIENQIAEVIEKQGGLSEENKQSEIKLLNEQIADLIKSSEKNGRNEWKTRFESFAINVLTSLIFSAEARLTFILAVQYLLNYLYQAQLYLPHQQ